MARNKNKYPNPYLPVGTRVRSHYRSPWIGVVEIVLKCEEISHNVVRCRITHDKNGIPMRKTFLSIPLDTYWLTVLEDNHELV